MSPGRILYEKTARNERSEYMKSRLTMYQPESYTLTVDKMTAETCGTWVPVAMLRMTNQKVARAEARRWLQTFKRGAK